MFRTNGSWPTEQVQDVWNAREVIHHLAVYNLGLREVGTTRGRGECGRWLVVGGASERLYQAGIHYLVARDYEKERSSRMLSRLAACFTARLRGSRFSARVKMAESSDVREISPWRCTC